MKHQKPPANRAALALLAATAVLALLAATAVLALLLLARTYRQPVIQPLTMELPFSQVQEG